MRKINIFILCLFLASTAFAAEKKSDKHRGAGNRNAVNEAPVEKSAPWNISAYPENNGYLPKNYQGVTPKKFLAIFKEKIAAISKEEIEPQGEFDLQKADMDSILSPIKASDLYAFRKLDVIVWYDNVSRYFVFRSKEDETFCDELSAEWNTCKIASLESSLSSYTGRFPEGSTTVKRTNITDFALAIRKSNPVFQSPAFIYDFTRMGFEYLIWVPPEDAKKLQGKKLGVLFVGSVAAPELMAGKETLSSSSFDEPMETYIQEEAIPFDLKKLVFYVVETGKILMVNEIQP